MERSTEISAARIAHRHGRLCCISACVLTFIIAACNNNGHGRSTALPYYNDPNFTAIWQSEKHFNTDTIHTIAAFRFTDQDNQPVTNKTFEGKIYVANFFFTRCGSICPKMTDNLKQVADSFENESRLMFISHSVTPEMDSVAALRSYADKHNVDAKRWRLVTGPLAAINKIARESYYIEKTPGLSKDSTEFLHTENLVLVDRHGHIRGLYKGTLGFDTNRLIEDIGILLKEED